MTAPSAPNWIARSATSSEPPPPPKWIQSTTPPRPNPGARKIRSARLPAAPPITAAKHRAAARLRTRSAKPAARHVIASAARVTRTGYPEASPPLAPVLRTRRTETHPPPLTAAGRAASTRDLLTWSAASTAAATPPIAQRTRADDRAAAPSGTNTMNRRYPAPARGRCDDAGTMKQRKHSVAVVVRKAGDPGGAFLVVKRPDDPQDPLAGVWGLPAVTLLGGEDERAAVLRAGRVKLGVELAAGRRIGERTADRGAYLLRLAGYEATVLAGVPAVPQPDASLTQYAACAYSADPGVLAEAAARGSLCAQVFLAAAGEPW